AGRLTQAQADAISATLQQRLTDLVNGAHPPLPGAPFGPDGMFQAAASYLGLTPAQLLTQLQSGKTLAQVANATSGKSAEGLVAALVAHAKQTLADAGSWVQPATTCKAGSSAYSAFWVGLGGFADGLTSLEQTGTESDCTLDGTPRYSAWYEILPAPAIPLKLVVRPGDTISASVAVSGR